MPLQSLETALKERSTLVCAEADAHAMRHAADKIVFVLMLMSRTPAISLPSSTGVYMCARRPNGQSEPGALPAPCIPIDAPPAARRIVAAAREGCEPQQCRWREASETDVRTASCVRGRPARLRAGGCRRLLDHAALGFAR